MYLYLIYNYAPKTSINKESKQWKKDRDSVKIMKLAPSSECRKENNYKQGE